MHFSAVALRRFLFSAPLLAATYCLPTLAHADDAPSVAVSIKPIHGIASAIMKDVGKPVLLLDGAASPHAYSLRPSEARALRDADLIVYVSDTLESFLQKPLQSLSKDSHQLELITADGLALRELRAGGNWDVHDHGDHDGHEEHEEHDHEDHDHESHHTAHSGDVDADDDAHDHHHDAHDHEDHDHDEDNHQAHDEQSDHEDTDHDHADHGSIDTHLWLDPANGAAIAVAIAKELSKIDPAHADQYAQNLKNLLASLTALRNDLEKKVAPVRTKPYIVFHDAYQYLEAGLALNAVGSITVSPDQKPGAKRLHDIEDKIRNTGAVCIFAEPQFRPAIIEAIVADTGIRVGTLDPLGAGITAGPDAYQQILSQNIDALVDCLATGS